MVQICLKERCRFHFELLCSSFEDFSVTGFGVQLYFAGLSSGKLAEEVRSPQQALLSEELLSLIE